MCVETFMVYPPLGRFAVGDMKQPVEVGVTKVLAEAGCGCASTKTTCFVKNDFCLMVYLVAWKAIGVWFSEVKSYRTGQNGKLNYLRPEMKWTNHVCRGNRGANPQANTRSILKNKQVNYKGDWSAHLVGSCCPFQQASTERRVEVACPKAAHTAPSWTRSRFSKTLLSSAVGILSRGSSGSSSRSSWFSFL